MPTLRDPHGEAIETEQAAGKHHSITGNENTHRPRAVAGSSAKRPSQDLQHR
jgi:hypothetical protein